MRTTLDIDDDILQAVEGIAAQSGKSSGKVLSELARSALGDLSHSGTRNGFPLFEIRADSETVTLEQINELRDELV